jgi:hypothetical protein
VRALELEHHCTVGKPSKEQKENFERIGRLTLQRLAPGIARNINLHRPKSPQLLADSVKASLELTDDWLLVLTIGYADRFLKESVKYDDILLKHKDDFTQYFFTWMSRLMEEL